MADPDAYGSFLERVRCRRPRVALIFGSGLGELDERLTQVAMVPFRFVPGLPGPTVPGHKGCLLLADWADVAVLVFSGRVHRYEGHPWRSVTQPVQMARDLGVETLIVTNAAGGIREDLLPGTLMALAGHLDWTQPAWWRADGQAQDRPTSASPYDGELRARLQTAAKRLGFELPEGSYAQVTGPCYETPAEIRALRQCGADAVGMSTVREINAAHALGMRCVAISCITNRAAGLSQGPIHHGEVLEVARQLRERLASLLEALLRSIA